jgi:co-chaperonin GroES (HSP10)|tara:strand:+ start:529 stop:954 length:426 start_codon:yes stop_codon:yes gene_type:complete
MQQVNLGKSIKNNFWISDDNEEDPNILPELPGYHILIRPISIKAETKGGILLPDAVKEDISYLTTVGRVLKIGDLAYKDLDKFPNGAWCNVNDYICYGKHSGQKLFYKGIRLLLLFDDQVMMKVENPTHLDPTFNLTKGSF